MQWQWPHLKHVRSKLLQVTLGSVDRIAFALPPQHGKTRSITVPYPAWRMLREPGLRCGIAAHTQRYADKISRWVRRLVQQAGGVLGDVSRIDEWELTNGSTFIARGVGGSIAGESLDLLMVDDVFGSREDADSNVQQENVHEWYMDDVTPRLQKTAAIVMCNTRWNRGDLIGRIRDSEEGPEWEYIRIPAIAETQEERDAANGRQGLPIGVGDPLNRAPGEALCPDRYPLDKLEQKRRQLGVGFETLYQQNDIIRGGSFFRREWFEIVDRVPEGIPNARPQRIRYFDLASSRKDSACYTAGVLMAKVGDTYYVEDVIRGRWGPAERNDMMLQTAIIDKQRLGFERTWFEQPVFDKNGDATRAIIAKLAGHAVRADNVGGAGSKEVRAEPLADAAKGGIIKVVAGSWVGAWLTELEGFPTGAWKDQVDSSSGAMNVLTKRGTSTVSVGMLKIG